MKSISPDIVLKPVKEYILMAVGMLMYSFGWIGCILPAGGVGGGAAGLSLVLCNALSVLGLNFQIGTMVFTSTPSCCSSPDLSWGGTSASRPSIAWWSSPSA